MQRLLRLVRPLLPNRKGLMRHCKTEGTSSWVAVTWIHDGYVTAPELRFSLQQLRQLVTPNRLVVCRPEEGRTLAELCRQHPDLSSCPLWLIIREPAMLCDRDVFVRLAQALERDPHLICAIAVDVFNDPPEQSMPFPYYSWRGFCLFQHALAKQGGAVRPYDGRRTFLFLLKPGHIPGSVPSTCPVMDIPKHVPKQSAGIIPQAFIHPLDNYHDQEREDVLALLPQAIASLLDVGCGSGRFGARVKKERGCRVVGVELDPSAAAKAASRLDKVIQGDILKAQLDEKFDVITCNDLLEHLEDPNALLHILKKHLQPAGLLLLSVPNVGHWSIIDDLLAGHWDYIPAGLLCISHLRFFTRKSIIDLMTACGWHVIRVETQHGPFVGSAKDRFVHLGDLGFKVAPDDLEALGFYILAQ